jgi:hypothetical protein
VSKFLTTTKIQLFFAMAALGLAGCLLALYSRSADAADARTPILVELFTSEGCSSCPPADRFLAKLDQQPVAGAEMIVLSEHVDYWNHIGWRDPYSARFYSDRQSAYAKRFGLESVYTPEMVVDGSSEFVGSDSGLADKSFAKALGNPKVPIHLSSLSIKGGDNLSTHVETGKLDPSFGVSTAEVYLAVAWSRAESQVSAGENAGKKLAHVSVVRRLTKIGDLKQGQAWAQDIQFKLPPSSDPRNLRVIAFVQEPRQGRVIGAAVLMTDAK